MVVGKVMVMEELVMLRLIVEAVVMKMVTEVMERMVMLMAVIAINMAMGVEMVLAVVMAMKIGATDNDDGDDNYDSQDSIGLLTRSNVFYIVLDIFIANFYSCVYFWKGNKSDPRNHNSCLKFFLSFQAYCVPSVSCFLSSNLIF